MMRVRFIHTSLFQPLSSFLPLTHSSNMFSRFTESLLFYKQSFSSLSLSPHGHQPPQLHPPGGSRLLTEAGSDIFLQSVLPASASHSHQRWSLHTYYCGQVSSTWSQVQFWRTCALLEYFLSALTVVAQILILWKIVPDICHLFIRRKVLCNNFHLGSLLNRSGLDLHVSGACNVCGFTSTRKENSASQI